MRKFVLSCSFLWVLSLGALAQSSSVIVGIWYDDLGSPAYGDATLAIERDSEKYFLSRRNGDGSGSRYRVEKNGAAFTKIGDRFGAKFVVTAKGLEIHDKAGYIRTAKPKPN